MPITLWLAHGERAVLAAAPAPAHLPLSHRAPAVIQTAVYSFQRHCYHTLGNWVVVSECRCPTHSGGPLPGFLLPTATHTAITKQTWPERLM